MLSAHGTCLLACHRAGALQGSAPASRAQRAPGLSPPALRAYLICASVMMWLELDYGILT